MRNIGAEVGPGGHASDIDAVVIPGMIWSPSSRRRYASPPYIRRWGSRFRRRGLALVNSCRVMEEGTRIAVDAFGDVDFTVFGPGLAIGPHARPVGNILRVSRRPGQPYPGLDETVREVELTVRA